MPDRNYRFFTAVPHDAENARKVDAMIRPPDPAPPRPMPPRDQVLMAKAKELETSFLAEMLSYAGLDAGQGGFAGSAGEDQFGSFLREAQARQMVEQGGIGLSERLFQSLTRLTDDQG